MATHTAKILTFTARELNDGRDSEYEFDGYELPSGIVLVPSEGHYDAIYDSRSDVEANGGDQVVGSEDTGRTVDFTTEELAEAVANSDSEFGSDGVSDYARRLLAPIPDWTLAGDDLLDAADIPANDLRAEALRLETAGTPFEATGFIVNGNACCALFVDGRAGVATGGDAVWTDASSLTDGIERVLRGVGVS